MKKNRKLVLISLLVLLIFIVVLFAFWILKSPFESNAIKIEIQNGSTGEIVELDNSQRDQLIQKLNSLETHVSGISGFSTGYEYKIIFFLSDRNTKELYVKNLSCVSKNGLLYRVNGNLVSIIQEFINLSLIHIFPERRFVRFLLEKRFVYRTASGNVLPYAKPANEGLFCVKDYCNHGHIGSYTLITPQGKLYFAQLRDMILMVV